MANLSGSWSNSSSQSNLPPKTGGQTSVTSAQLARTDTDGKYLADARPINSPTTTYSYPSESLISGGGSSGGGSSGGGGNTGGGGGGNSPAPSVDYNALLEAAYQRALGYGNQQVVDRGYNSALIDQYGVLDAYKTLLDQRRSEIDPTAGGDLYGQFAVSDYFNNAVDAGQTRYRTDLRNAITGVAGDGFEYDAFGDTADDSILQAIYDTQRNDAQLVLDRAKARGQLNDVGYNRAVTDLAGQGKGGLATLQGIGGGILADYRNRLATEKNTGLSRADSASFTQPFDAQSIVNRLNSLRDDLSNSLEGDIYKAVGGTTFFTPSVSIGKGGSTQGTVNPSKINFSENPLLQAFADTGSSRRSYGTNTGSTATTGAF